MVGKRLGGRSGTSQANPTKLALYAEDGMAMVTTLEGKVTVVSDAADALARSGTSVSGIADLVAGLEELCADWYHLDEFAGDVAAGFLAYLEARSGIGPQLPGLVVTLTDSRLARLGQVGYADRDRAIADANAAAAELQVLRDRLGARGIDPDEVGDLMDRIARGQYDPAFAVTFSEAVGVDGYVEAMAAIRSAYQGDVPDAGIDAVEVLAVTLTTALDTRPGIRASHRHDPSNADLATDQRLGDDVVDDLVNMELPWEGPFEFGGSEQDLSLLMSFTVPPTSVAVAVANARLTPNLESTLPWDMTAHGQQWGDRGDVVANYGRMLAANPDASALWLYSSPGGDTNNLELVLERPGDADADAGRALAQVVENGLTHPTYDVIRGNLMETGIETIGDQGEIRNPHLNQALAEGVAHNMDVVDHVINDNWLDPEELDDLDAPVPASTANAHVFLREVMEDPASAVTVAGATERYMLGQLADLPDRGLDLDRDGVDTRLDALNNIGTLHGVLVAAAGNVDLGAIEDHIASQEARGDGLNFAIGLLPTEATALNDLLDIAGHSAGELAFPTDISDLGESQLRTLALSDTTNSILLAMAENPERVNTATSQMSDAELEAFFNWATSPTNYDGWDHAGLSAATWRAAIQFLGDT